MDSKKPSCFISYCISDCSDHTLQFFKDWLVELSDNNLEILFYDDLKIGGDIDKFMEKLKEVDSAIIILTPDYKKRVLERKGGVYKEYTTICKRNCEIEEAKKDGEEKIEGELSEDFVLIPILFSGDEDSSILQEIKHIKYLDLVHFRANQNDRGKLFITNQTEKKYKEKVKKVVDHILTVNSTNSNEYKTIFKNFFNFLFTELKAEWHDTDSFSESLETNKKLFVKTNAYENVLRQSRYFLIGRKGSGKSTASTFMAYQGKDKYKGVILIVADKFNLENIFGLLSEDRIRSDTSNVVTIAQTFQFAWEIFFYLYCMDVLIFESNTGRLTKYQEDLVSPIKKYISEILKKTKTEQHKNVNHEQDIKTATFFTYSINAVIEFIEKCIKDARSNSTYFHSDITASFSFKNFLNQTVDRKAISSFNSIIDVCRRRILITLDGFDSIFDRYRKTSINEYREPELIRKRSLLEIEWLRAVLQLALKIKLDLRIESKLYNIIDFCITLPKDRFIEVLATERDSYVYEKRYIDLNWSGLELVILLRKRLEVFTSYSTSKNLNPEERLSDVLKAKFPNLPTKINISKTPAPCYVDIFLFVLRYTFWRPRDILRYFASILTIHEEMKKKKIKVTEDILVKKVKDTAYRIIRSEFINEFDSTLYNLKDVIYVFRECNQTMHFKEFQEKLAEVNFQFAHMSGEVNDFETKLKFLYSIGFVGVRASDEIKERYGLRHKHAYYFNEGSMVLKALGTEFFHNCSLIIHPIFVDYLHLKPSLNETSLIYTWEYIRENEALLFAD